VGGKRYKPKKLIPPPPNLGASEQAHTLAMRAEYSSFSGPLPPPEILARYNEIIPGGAERILSMAEPQSVHRESLESKVVDGNLANQKTGSLRAFILAMSVILLGAYLMATGKDGWGFAAIVTSLASLVAVFVIGKVEQKKEREEKAAALAVHRPKSRS
jgi:uncharacterized membrane protein